MICSGIPIPIDEPSLPKGRLLGGNAAERRKPRLPSLYLTTE
jgi:hypothetical protein